MVRMRSISHSAAKEKRGAMTYRNLRCSLFLHGGFARVDDRELVGGIVRLVRDQLLAALCRLRVNEHWQRHRLPDDIHGTKLNGAICGLRIFGALDQPERRDELLCVSATGASDRCILVRLGASLTS